MCCFAYFANVKRCSVVLVTLTITFIALDIIYVTLNIIYVTLTIIFVALTIIFVALKAIVSSHGPEFPYSSPQMGEARTY